MKDNMNAIKRLLNVLPGELGLVVTLGFLLFGNSFALEVSDIVSTSGFLSQVSVPNILIVWIIDMTLILISAGLQSLIVDRFHRIQLMRWMSIILGAAYIGLRFLFVLGAPAWLSYSLLFLISDQSWLFFPLIFWVLANDLFDVAQGKRLFPLLIAIGFFGQIAGILVATLAPSVLSSLALTSVELLELNAVIYLLIYVVVLFGFRKVNIKFTPHKGEETLRHTITEGWEFVKNVDSFRYMCMAYLGLAVVITVIRFNFLSFTTENVAQADFQQFYGIYRLILIVSSIIMTSFIASRLTKGIGLKNAFLITPISLLLITITAFVSAWLPVITGGMIFAWLMYYTIDQSTRKTFQGLVPEERRGRVSMFIDSYVPASGAILASVLLGAVIIFGQLYGWSSSASIYLIIGALGALFCIWATIKLRSTYDSSLLNPRMKRRQRRSDALDKLKF
jgi:ATP:ADP antiporter, AAA family